MPTLSCLANQERKTDRTILLGHLTQSECAGGRNGSPENSRSIERFLVLIY